MQKAFPIFVMELFCDGWLFLELLASDYFSQI